MDDMLEMQYVVFELSDERYALKISDVYEIIKMQKITVIHNSKPFLEGVINLRGKIVPVVSLHKKFGLTNYEVSKSTRIIFVKSNDEMIGIVVDRVNHVIKFSDIQPPPDMVAGIDGNNFTGIGISEEGMASILEINHILSD
ncbi:purine-binding chemotaxis protein CheW [Caloramator sp. E03]|uniref:chemotaxis protein CheW n=1 Tax=Caloramator sp. E03 TaxID=2576307 RepID=UPI0011109E38|nr:chemotaxis protein CheW [Caloramator sp. E03]QCX33203.1 purine-binding chemotaxis protein CheW [Caloramator sp. E03]